MFSETLKAVDEEEFGTIVDETVCNFYCLSEEDETVNALPEEPELYEVETTLGTGASAHASDRVDFPATSWRSPLAAGPGSYSAARAASL